MKLRKRLVSLVLAFGMLASCLPTAFAEENPPQQNLTQSDQKAAAPTEGTCGEKVTWKLAGGTLTISGVGEMKDYAHDTVPWKDSRDAITRVVVESGVTTVGNYAFYGCKNLTQVSLPDGLTCIGGTAFAGNSSLTEIKIPSSVNEIKSAAFQSCSSISSVNIPDGVTIINGSTFYGCSNLRSVTIPDSVVTIGDRAFRDCTALTGISIPNSVVNIGSQAFQRCTSLREIEIPDSVRHIYDAAFAGCINLQNIRLSEQLSEMSSEVFQGCSSLKEITIPDNVTTIENDAFENCTKLEKIVIGKNVSSIPGKKGYTSSPFYECVNLSKIYFTGDAPHFDDGAFSTVTATAYYPRNASGWEDVIQNQYNGTITWTPWTPGETPEPPATRQFQIDRDAWGFTNSTSAFGKASEGYYITQADYDRLTAFLPETEKKKISTTKKTKRFWEYKARETSKFNIDGKDKNHIDWGGSCYGMSVWACLTKDGVRKISELDSTAENLHSVAFSPQVESAINFYQHQQDLTNVILAAKQFIDLPQNEQLERLESQVSDNKVSMIRYRWYKKFDKDGEAKNDSFAGHAVVGYGVESGTWNKTVNGSTDTYTKRILIYDCARGQYDEEYDLYYNDSGIWCIPGRNIRSASNEIHGKGDNGILFFASNDEKILNAVDYAPIDFNMADYAPAILSTSSENSYSVNWGSGSADINGAISSNVSGTDRVDVIVETNVTADGTTGEVSASAVLPEAKEYTIKSSEDGMPYELQNENYLTVAASKKSGTIKLQADGGAKIDTQEAGDYYISMTANDGYHELPWSTVEISGKDGKQISADMTDEGIVVSGDNLKDMTITGENDDQTQEVTVSTDKSDVLISSDNGDISVKQDSDGDGKYETDIVKPTPDPKPTTPVTEIFSDIYPSAWYIDYVQFVYDNGLMTGTSKTTFAPEVTLSRAMVAQVLYNYDKRVDSPYRATNGKTFKDVSKNDWFYEAIQWASANGIASGVGNGYFEPNSPVTREQVAQFLYNYNGRPSVSGNLPFSDADKVSGWAKNAMLWAYQNKIINGTTSPDGGLLLDPQGGATRAQAAAILTNYMKNMM